LYLWGNQLSGSIPSELGNLTNLTELYLDGNQLSGEIPSELGDLTNLTALWLSGNGLRGCVPAVWRSVEDNDLDSLGLPFCSASSTTDTTDRAASGALYPATEPGIAPADHASKSVAQPRSPRRAEVSSRNLPG